MLIEFARCYKMRTGKIYDIATMHIWYVLHSSIIIDFLTVIYVYSCLAHIINLAAQALISTRSTSNYFSPHDDPESDNIAPTSDGANRDEVDLIRAICVRVRLYRNL